MNVRRPEAADLEAVLELMRVTDIAVAGDSDWTASELRSMWDELDLTRDAWLFELDGKVAGYADFIAKGSRLNGDGYVHPELRGRGIGIGDPAPDRGTGARGGAERPGRGARLHPECDPRSGTRRPRASIASAATSPCAVSVG